MAAFGELLGRLDPDPLRRGKQFERICRWFLTHDPVYARELRQVWLWGEWPDRWGADAGIDLVAEDRHGHLWGEAKPVCCSMHIEYSQPKTQSESVRDCAPRY